MPPHWLMVTGAMRSGTTFVGRILATGHTRAYVHEPFNPQCGLNDVPIRYLVDDSELGREYRLDDAIRSIMSLRCQLGQGIYRRDTGMRRMGKSIVGGRGRLNLRWARVHPALEFGVVKDPIGALVAPTLHRDHGVKIVVMVRHPVAWYASIVHHGFQLSQTIDSFVRQQQSSDGLMTPTEVDLATQGDHLERAAVIWNVIYRRLHRELDGKPGAVFVKHEDLCADPEATFLSIGAALTIPIGRYATRRIERSTRSTNAVEPGHGRAHGFRRDSRHLFEHRVNAVVEVDRRRLAELCGPIAAPWYDQRSFTDGGTHGGRTEGHS